MSKHRYLLLLGTDTDDDSPLRQARSLLSEGAELLRESGTVHGPSVVPDDPHRYINQALLIEGALGRDDMAAHLKRLERDLGRRRDGDGCSIDIDLVAECDMQNDIVWSNPEKLAHALFRELAVQVLPDAAASLGAGSIPNPTL